MIVWADFATHETTPMALIQSQMNSELYMDKLVEKLLPLIAAGNYFLRQDHAILNVSRATCPWFESNTVQFLN